MICEYSYGPGRGSHISSLNTLHSVRFIFFGNGKTTTYLWLPATHPRRSPITQGEDFS